jgi:hypothetical protein
LWLLMIARSQTTVIEAFSSQAISASCMSQDWGHSQMGCLTLTSLAYDAEVSERVCCICAIPNFFSELRAGRASKEHPLSCLRGFLETMKEEIKYDMANSF